MACGCSERRKAMLNFIKRLNHGNKYRTQTENPGPGSIQGQIDSTGPEKQERAREDSGRFKSVKKG